MKTEPTRLDLSKTGYRMESEDGHIETGYYSRVEQEEDPSEPDGFYVPGCEGCCGEKRATWENRPNDPAAEGYSGLCWCDDCVESSLEPSTWAEGVRFSHFDLEK